MGLASDREHLINYSGGYRMDGCDGNALSGRRCKANENAWDVEAFGVGRIPNQMTPPIA